MTTSPTSYRPALRGLLFGLYALGLRAATMGFTCMSSLEVAAQVLPWMNVVASLVALVGVGYSAIAAHRREWGATLVFAFLCSVVAAVFDIEPFVYAVL